MFRTGTLPPLLTVNSMKWVLKKIVKLEDNRELVQDQDMQHENSRELRYQSDLMVKNMSLLTLTTFMIKFLYLRQEATQQMFPLEFFSYIISINN